MEAARRFRRMVVAEDAGDDMALWAVEPDEDALDHALAPEETWPDWRCGDCGQKWDGAQRTCGYCGTWREDIDQL